MCVCVLRWEWVLYGDNYSVTCVIWCNCIRIVGLRDLLYPYSVIVDYSVIVGFISP